MEILIAVLAAVITGCGGCLVYLFKRHTKKLEKLNEEAEKKRARKDFLVLKSLRCIGELAMANSKAVQRGSVNGELVKAQKEFEIVEKELNAFLLELAASITAKKK